MTAQQPPFGKVLMLDRWATATESPSADQCQLVKLTNPPTLKNEMVGGFFRNYSK